MVQRTMSMLLNGLQGVLCHLDDILIWGKVRHQHDARLHTVLHKLQEAGVTLNLEKCELSKQEVKFLGHILSTGGIKLDPDKTKVVRKVKELSKTSGFQLRGMVNQLGNLFQAWLRRTSHYETFYQRRTSGFGSSHNRLLSTS